MTQFIALALPFLLSSPIPSGTGDYDRDVVRRVVRAHIGEVRDCYDAGLRADPDLEGKVVLSFTITGDGSVSDATIVEATIHRGVPECIASAAAKWIFPKPEGGGNVKITYPFLLEPT